MENLCKVLSFNKSTHIAVVDYNGTQIQFPTNYDSLPPFVHVRRNGSKYDIVDSTLRNVGNLNKNETKKTGDGTTSKAKESNKE